MKKNQLLSIVAVGCIINLSIQSAHMFSDNAGNSTNHTHLDDQTLTNAQAAQLPLNTLLTSGDSSEAKLVIIQDISTQGGIPEFDVYFETIKPESKTFQNIVNAQSFALEILQKPTQQRLKEEALNQQKAYAQQQSSANSNKYLTGGQRSKRKGRKYNS